MSDQEAVQLVQAGVSGIVHKHQSTDVLCGAIRQIAGGEVFMEQSYLAPLFRAVDRTRTPKRASLTDRDKTILRCILQGLANREIAGKLQISEGAVKASVRHVCEKLGVRTRSQLVKAAWRSTRISSERQPNEFGWIRLRLVSRGLSAGARRDAASLRIRYLSALPGMCGVQLLFEAAQCNADDIPVVELGSVPFAHNSSQSRWTRSTSSGHRRGGCGPRLKNTDCWHREARFPEITRGGEARATPMPRRRSCPARRDCRRRSAKGRARCATSAAFEPSARCPATGPPRPRPAARRVCPPSPRSFTTCVNRSCSAAEKI